MIKRLAACIREYKRPTILTPVCLSLIHILQHISNLYYTEPCAKLAQLLCEKTGMKKVFFGNSGAEANECAIKAARKWSEDKKGKEYSTRCV